MKKKKLLIIGGSSFFSINFIKELFQDYEITGSYFSKKTLKINKIKINITNKKNILNNVKKFRPDIILNAAGLTDVEECERNYKKAFNLNALGSKYLSEICTKFKIKLIHISTDHLFDGKKSFYKELDKTKPVNNYGKTKTKKPGGN